MQQNILLTGLDDFLAALIAAFELARTDESSIRRIQPGGEERARKFQQLVVEQFARIATGRSLESVGNEVASRLQISVVRDKSKSPQPASLQNLLVDKVWHFIPTQRDFNAEDHKLLMQFLGSLSHLGIHEFNLVMSGSLKTGGPETEAIEQCQMQNIPFRVFQTSLIMGENPALRDHDFPYFLHALYQLKQEIESRLPKYFDFEPIRWLAPQEVEINLIRPETAAEIMARISWREETLNHSFDIASPENTSFSDLCERIESVYNLGLTLTEQDGELTAIDRAFEERTGLFQEHLTSPRHFDWEKAYKAGNWNNNTATLDEDAQIDILESLRGRQSETRAQRDQRVVTPLDQLNRKSISKNGFDLTYFVAGSAGTPVLILNALGQGLVYWYRLIDILKHKYQMIIWEPRGTISPPQPFGLKEQVEDIEAILQQEEIQKCHMVGWCTGPKLAVEFYLRAPDFVQSMVFLNSQFKCEGMARELITKYERNLEPLFRVLEKKPEMAGSVMESMRLNLGGEKINLFDQKDSQKLAMDVLTLVDETLKPHILAPYQNEATTLAYAQQVLDFWSYDTLAKAPQVQAPILMIATEYDKVAAPAMSKAAVNYFPRVKHVEISRATHYCLFDRPELVADLVEDFWENANPST